MPWSMSTQNGPFYHAEPSYFLRVRCSIQKWPNTMGLGHIDIFHRPSPGPFRNEFCNQLDCIERHIIHVRQACLKPFDLMRREILLGIYYPQLSLIIRIGNCSMYQIGTLDIPILQMLRLLEQYVCTYFYCTRRGMIFILRHGGKIKALFVYILYDVSYSSNTIRHHYLHSTEDLSLGLIIWFLI